MGSFIERGAHEPSLDEAAKWDSAEAKAEATERSLLHIIKPEIDFEPIADEHSQEVYDKAVENFRAWREKGWLEQDPGGVLLHLCADDGRPHAIRTDHVLPLRGLPLGGDQETRN